MTAIGDDIVSLNDASEGNGGSIGGTTIGDTRWCSGSSISIAGMATDIASANDTGAPAPAADADVAAKASNLRRRGELRGELPST